MHLEVHISGGDTSTHELFRGRSCVRKDTEPLSCERYLLELTGPFV